MNDTDGPQDRKKNQKNLPCRPHIAAPPHVHLRRDPLPGHRPKAIEEDPDAMRQVAEIQKSSSYLQGDQDVEFLNRDDTRGLRLQIDYQKPESLLEQHDIAHTIVVFGSTRIPEPAAAVRNAEALRTALAAAPADADLQCRLAIAERVVAKSGYYTIAQEFGCLVGAASVALTHERVVIMTGGGPGIMEGANRGAYEVGAKSVGLNISLPHEQYPNPYVTPDLCFRFHYFALRKLHFLLRARALVVFPGGYGTLDEMFETLTLVQTRKIRPLPVILVGQAYWRRAFDVDFLVDEGTIDIEDRELFWYAETAQEIWDGILLWHQINGEPLLPESAASAGSTGNP